MAQPVCSVSFSAATALRDNRYVSKRRALARADFFCARPSQEGWLSVCGRQRFGSGTAGRAGPAPPPRRLLPLHCGGIRTFGPPSRQPHPPFTARPAGRE